MGVAADRIDTSLVVRIKIGHQPRYLLALLWVGLLVGLLILVFPGDNTFVYLLIASLAAFVAGLVILILPQFNYLELSRAGFTTCNFRVVNKYRWRDVYEVATFSTQGRDVIGVRLSPQLELKDREKHQEMWGYDLVLNAHYELSPAEIVGMMNIYRESR